MSGMSGMSGMSDMSGMSSPPGIPGMPATKGGMGAMTSVSAQRGGDAEIADLQSRLNATLALHARMMADAVVRERVLQDPEMRRLAEAAAMSMPSMSAKASGMPVSDSARGGMSGMSGMKMTPRKRETRATTPPKRGIAPVRKAAPSRSATPTPAKKKPMAPMAGMPGMSNMPGMSKP